MANESPLTQKIFSLEMLGVMAAAMLTLSGIWFSLVGKVEASDEIIQEVRGEQKAQAASIKNIDTSIALIELRLKVAEDNAKAQTRRTEEIIDILKKEYRAHQ